MLDVPAEPLIAHARQLEKAAAPEEAAKLFSAWLDVNPGASGSASVFGAYLSVEQDLPALFDQSARFLQSGKGVPGAAGQFERIARLFDLAGRIEEARNAYMAAHDEGAPDSTLVSAFLLSLQMNDADMMTASLDQMAGKGESGELLLRALSEIHAGDRAAAPNPPSAAPIPPSAARETLIGLADQTGNPDIALKALWILYQAARGSGDSAGQAAARSKLGTRFAAAPETALAAGPSPTGSSGPRPIVVQMPAPGPFETGSAPPKADSPSPANSEPGTQAQKPSTPAVNSQAAQPSSLLISVQAGSFLMKENADDLLSELTHRGFAAVVVHEVAQGKDRYRVLAGAGLEAEAAKGVLKKLSDAGFRGFLVQDK